MGCSSSVSVIAKAQRNVENLNPLNEPKAESKLSSAMDFIENSVLVWLTDQPSQKISEYNIQFRRVISALKIFDDCDACYTFLANSQNEIILLIVSTKHEEFIERIDELPQIYKIYIFDLTTHMDVKDTQDQPRQIGIFRNINELCDQLGKDRELVDLDSFSIVTINPSAPSGTSPKRIAAFLIGQLLKFIIVPYKVQVNAKTKFVDFCREHYVDDKERLHDIDDFDRNYRPKDALKWLTKTYFFSSILNRTQRLLEYDLIYKVMFMMQHVHMVLVNYHENMNSLLGNTSLILYRGKTMSQDEFNNFTEDINGSFLSSRAFLTAHTNMNVAIDFLRQIITHHPERISILFEIYIDPTPNRTAPFALLERSHHHMQSQSDEFCFTFGTIFHVESIEKNENFFIDIWVVKLVMADERDRRLSALLKQVRSNEVQANPAVFFTKLCMDAGYLHLVEKHYFQLLQDESIVRDPSRFVRLSCAVADVLMKKNEFEKAIPYYERALNSSLSIIKSDHLHLIPIYNSLGECYSKINNYISALENYEKAAEIMLRNGIQSIDEETMKTLNTHINDLKKLIQGSHEDQTK